MSENVIDLQTFNSLKEIGDAEFISELIDTFLEDAPHMLNELDRALTENNPEQFRRAAHSLKSNANTFGALAFAELARELESLGRDNQLGSAGEKFEVLTVEYAKVANSLKGLRNA